MERGRWGSRLGFVLAAAGSAVGLGNLWKFPYIAGEHGGGAFVLIYLAFIVMIGVPVMMGEIVVGRMTGRSPLGAYRAGRTKSGWSVFGYLGILAAFCALSYYGVVAGWSLHYFVLSVNGSIGSGDPDQMQSLFQQTVKRPWLVLGWQFAFMALTIYFVAKGIRGGIEKIARILMPALFFMLIALAIKAAFSDGFGEALDFVFGFHTDRLGTTGVLEALGHSFFTLSLGIGGMITYGSYLQRDADITKTTLLVAGLDTAVALLACLVLFPITFGYGMEAASGPGLIFVNMPIALAQMPGGTIWAVLFFALVVFAALTSSVSLLEVVTSHLVDDRKWSRRKSAVISGGLVTLFGVPAALSFSTEMFSSDFASSIGPIFGKAGKSWFDAVDYMTSNWFLPLGGLGIALFVSYGPLKHKIEDELGASPIVFALWRFAMRILVPAAIVFVMADRLGII